MPLILLLQHGGVEAKRLQQSSSRSFPAPNVVYYDEVRGSGFILIAEGPSMRVPLRQWESVFATLLRGLTVPIPQRLMRESRISGGSRDRAGRQFQLAQILEDVVNLSVSVHVMRTFDHAVKLRNHTESDLDSQK
jgi:hypothetical protein